MAVSGDVGVLADENTQRLISIFVEAGMSCLLNLRDVVEKEMLSRGRGGGGGGLSTASFLKYYSSGLASIGQWSMDMLQQEVADIEAQYPETFKLHQFVFVSMLSETVYSRTLPGLLVPAVAETYHAFLKRLVASTDVQRGPSFLEEPLAHRRVVFLEAFRNAYHDMARKTSGTHLEMPANASFALSGRAAGDGAGFEDEGSEVLRPKQPSTFSGHKRLAPEARGARDKPQPAPSEEGARSSKSRLEKAMEEARSEATPTPPRAPPGPDGSRAVLLMDSPPTFFEEEQTETVQQGGGAPAATG